MASPATELTDLLKSDGITSLAEAQLLLIARNRNVSALWGRPNLMAELLQLRQAAEALAVPLDPQQHPGDERAHYLVRPPWSAPIKSGWPWKTPYSWGPLVPG